MNAEATFSGRVLAAVFEGRTIPCGRWGEHPWWTSDAAEDRARAALLCGECPAGVPDACRALADDTKATCSVWAGHDYNDRANQRWKTRR